MANVVRMAAPGCAARQLPFVEHVLGDVERLVFGDRGEVSPNGASDEEHQVITEHGPRRRME